MLFSSHVAGVLFGKNGAMALQLASICRCRLDLSCKSELFPGTRDRVCVVSGEFSAVSDCVTTMFKGLRYNFGPSVLHFTVTFVVSNSFVNSPKALQRLVEAGDFVVSVSRQVPNMREHLVLASGQFHLLLAGALNMIHTIHCDAEVADTLQTRYSIDLLLDVWWGTAALPASNAKFLHPADAGQHTRRHSVEYLQKTFPSHVLMQHCPLCSPKQALKSKRQQDLVSAVCETWELCHLKTTPPESHGWFAEKAVDHEALSASEDGVHARVYRQSECAASQPVRTMPFNNQPLSPQAQIWMPSESCSTTDARHERGPAQVGLGPGGAALALARV